MSSALWVRVSAVVVAATAGALKQASSTGGAGGVLDSFYEPWKLHLTLQHTRYAAAMAELYEATYATAEGVWEHPHGDFDSSQVPSVCPQSALSLPSVCCSHYATAQVWAHVDRIGFRVPDSVSQLHSSGKRTLQRSLTPHLDCCPNDMHSGGGKQFAR